jgi:hypothetical protein
MPVYFVREASDGPIKIGRASQVRRRVSQLQTGNSTSLQLLGWVNGESDPKLERELHLIYAESRFRGEWFQITQDQVLHELQSRHGFIPKKGDAFEIVGYDRDGVPEYAGVCEWADFEHYECCPFCGCFCGLHQVSEYALYSCVNCGTLVDDEMGQEPRDEV